MTRPRIYLPCDLEPGNRYNLTEGDRRYLQSVLRLETGDAILVFNGKGREGEGIVDSVGDKNLCVAVQDVWSASPEDLSIILAQALPKSGKMDVIIQKATELGVSRIIPFISHRCVPRLDEQKSWARQERWQKIAMEAARQCRRAHIPDITPILPFADMLIQSPTDSFKMILWEEEMTAGIRSLLTCAYSVLGRECVIAVGPEGGFTSDEIDQAKGERFLTASLGRHVLRTETASLAAIAIIQYEIGRFFDLTGGKDP
ncbi:MAG: Ribosomal RNA small subunit methyltransferase E [Syntrophus sp. SKADARSKE-3]|nr:Ribosomal RNA small subunit methyltransferase E [Syntrophus sp. SKADARSKE-3]